jgi:hypothetical protein
MSVSFFKPFAEKAQLPPIVNEFMKPKPLSPTYAKKASPFVSATTPKHIKKSPIKLKSVKAVEIDSTPIVMEYPAESSIVFPSGLSLQRPHVDSNGISSKAKPTGLSSDTVNWINKHRPKTSAVIPGGFVCFFCKICLR